ncbi:MAG: hypothetical protein NVSMB6_22710 [Burkholderiaceae bacterium]
MTHSTAIPAAPSAAPSTKINTRGRICLPNIAITFLHDGRRCTATFSRHPNGKVAEIYLDGGAIHNTSARLASLLLANGVDLETIRRAIIGGPLAIVLDRIIALDEPQDPESKGAQ